MSTLEAVLEQYEKNKLATSSAGKFSSEEKMKKFFTTVLPKGQKTAERRIRILETKDGSSPFVEVKFHEIQVDGKWVKLYDPAQEGKRSPLNEVAEGLKLTGKAEDKELAKQYYSRKFYIVKLIDRDHEDEGVKFWRFKHNGKSEGIIDKIIPIWRNKGDITDPKKGRDLILTLSLTKSGNGKEYTIVSSIIPEDPGPLSDNKELVTTWLNDEVKWSDVYSMKDENYLTLVAKGEIPKWSQEAKKWVSNSNGEVTLGSSNGTPETVDAQENEEPADDLPF